MIAELSIRLREGRTGDSPLPHVRGLPRASLKQRSIDTVNSMGHACDCAESSP
jgi:hypothetical protein